MLVILVMFITVEMLISDMLVAVIMLGTVRMLQFSVKVLSGYKLALTYSKLLQMFAKLYYTSVISI